MHGKRILKLLQKIFSWLPLATVIDQKVLVLHGGISDVTDLSILARLDRHNVRSCDKLSLILDQTCLLISCHFTGSYLTPEITALVCSPSMFQRWGLQRRDTRAQWGRPSTQTWTRTSGPTTGSSSVGSLSRLPNPSEPATASRTARCRTSPTGSNWLTSWRPAGRNSPFSTLADQRKKRVPLCPLSLSTATTQMTSGNRWWMIPHCLWCKIRFSQLLILSMIPTPILWIKRQ